MMSAERYARSAACRKMAPVIAGLLLLCQPNRTFAQVANMTPSEQGGSSTTETCTWYLSKYWDQNWGWISIQFNGTPRTYGTDSDASYDREIQVSITLNTTYLPSQSLSCMVIDVGTEDGPVDAPYGNSYTVNHVNSTCDGYTTLIYGYDPTHSYWVSEEMYNTNVTMAYGASDAGAYWTSMGQELFFTTLSTPPGGESGVYPYPNPPPDEIARWDPASNQIWLNNTNFGSAFGRDQWAWLTAHELGHAIGFGHTGSSDYSRTIMMNGGTPSTGLQPRPLDKCSAVQAFPVDIQVGN